MKETKQKYWNTGVSNQPRFLAQFNGKTFARYDEFGNCIVGNGLPPMHINTEANEKTPVYITPSAREWLVTLEYFQKKFADKPEDVPHMVWAAKDVNWKLVAKSFKNKEVVVMRSKQDETQIEWAIQTQELLEKNGISAIIKPEIKNKMNKKP